MSLNARERERTRAELQRAFELVGRDADAVAADLDVTPDRLRRTVAVDDADPADVWLLRDYLVQAAADLDRGPVVFTVLTDAARAQADAWFDLRRAPRRDTP
ncbi:MAG: DUF2316 family protein [Microbacterium sp.]|uniref:DUF2316 family protein n=1 Tax=Microbacterium sp. TaxID=51671 RepID=UPI0039E3314A